MRLWTSIEIATSRDEVWRVLTDFDSYGQWNPYIGKIRGLLSPGEKLDVTARPPGGVGRTFSPTVTGVREGEEFRWSWSLSRPWIFTGEHVFVLEEPAPGRTRLNHYEDFTGWLAPLHRLFRYAATRRGFKAMNVALRSRLEGNGK